MYCCHIYCHSIDGGLLTNILAAMICVVLLESVRGSAALCFRSCPWWQWVSSGVSPPGPRQPTGTAATSWPSAGLAGCAGDAEENIIYCITSAHVINWSDSSLGQQTVTIYTSPVTSHCPSCLTAALLVMTFTILFTITKQSSED